MKTYKRKPLEVQAVQWTGDNFDEVRDFARSIGISIGISIGVNTDNKLLIIDRRLLKVGYWIVKDILSLSLLHNSDFEEMFEPAF